MTDLTCRYCLQDITERQSIELVRACLCKQPICKECFDADTKQYGNEVCKICGHQYTSELEYVTKKKNKPEIQKEYSEHETNIDIEDEEKPFRKTKCGKCLKYSCLCCCLCIIVPFVLLSS